MKNVIKSLYPEPRWKKRGVGWFAGTSDRGAMAAGIRAFKKDCENA